jgi:TetR/AcrR family transcriptional repressor of nem operon
VGTRVAEKRAEKRAQELVLAAYRRIAEGGFEGLRTRDVAADVGVNIATLHYYFPTKEALIRGVVEHAMGRFRTSLTPHGSAESQLRNYLRGTRSLLRKEPELGAVMTELVLRSARDPSTRKIMAGMYSAWHTTVRGLLKRAAAAGELREDLDIEGAVALIIATLSAIAMPQMREPREAEQALRALERSLGIDGR